MSEIRIAALILAHHRPDNLRRLMDRLGGPLWKRYLHLDAKADEACFAELIAQATPVEDRIAVHWGGYSQIAAALRLLRLAARDEGNTHFLLLSGQCYPLVEDEAIRQRIEEAPATGANFVSIDPMPTASKPIERLSRRHFHDVRSPRLRRVLNIVGRLAPRRDVARLLPGVTLGSGSCWWLFDRAAVKAMLGFLEANPWFERGFAQSNCADEIFFQTLFQTVGLTAAGRSPTGWVWVEGRPNPEPVTAESYPGLVERGFLFARKFVDYYPD